MTQENEEEWAFPKAMQPKQNDFSFELDGTLEAVVGVRAEIPDSAFTADTLGTDRQGNGVLIRDDGIVLTIGYLITEATTIWLTTNSGAVVQAYPLGYDQRTGFGLVRALGPLGVAPMAIGRSAECRRGDDLLLVGQGGHAHAACVRLIDKREFAGYWEYLLDEALFTSPAHPQWGGAALVNNIGELVGVGSLLVQEVADEDSQQGNMVVPIDLLEPILESLISTGAVPGEARPWLGVFASDSDEQLTVAGVSSGGPADKANLQRGDVILRVGADRVSTLAGFLRAVWASGPAGVAIALTVSRDGDVLRVEIESANRTLLLKGSQLH